MCGLRSNSPELPKCHRVGDKKGLVFRFQVASDHIAVKAIFGGEITAVRDDYYLRKPQVCQKSARASSSTPKRLEPKIRQPL